MRTLPLWASLLLAGLAATPLQAKEPAAAAAAPPSITMSFLYWEGSDEERAAHGQHAESSGDSLLLKVMTNHDIVLDVEAPLAPQMQEVLEAAVTALIEAHLASPEAAPIERPSIGVEWMSTTHNSMISGMAVFAPDALPPALIEAQKRLFGGPIEP